MASDAREAFFVPLTGTLNQGDLVAKVPWGLIDTPTTICRPVDRSMAKGKANYAPVAECSTPWQKDPEYIHGVARDGLAVVLWHGCQIDKFTNIAVTEGSGRKASRAFVAVAPLLPITKLQPESLRHTVLAGEHYSYFPVPQVTVGEVQIPESYVDLRHIWSIRQTSLTAARVVGMSEVATLSLMQHLFTFFTRLRLDIVPSCPTCGAVVPLVAAPAQD